MRKILPTVLFSIVFLGRPLSAGPALPTQWTNYSYGEFHYSFSSPFALEPAEKNYKPGYLMSIPAEESADTNFKMLIHATSLNEQFKDKNFPFKKIPDAMLNMLVEVKATKQWVSYNRWFYLPGHVPACVTRASGITPKGRKDEYVLLTVLRGQDLWFVLMAYPYGDKDRFKLASQIIGSFKLLD